MTSKKTVAAVGATGAQGGGLARAILDDPDGPFRPRAVPQRRFSNTFQLQHEFNDHYCGARSIEESRALNPAIQSFEQWLAQNKRRIPI